MRRASRSHSLAVGIAGSLLIIGGCQAEIETDSANQTEETSHAVVDASLSTLAADFSADTGKVRLVFIVGPSCGPCLRGLEDMNKALGNLVRSDGRITAFVVHVPTLGAQERHVGPASKLFDGANIHHYWDPEGASGIAYQDTLKLVSEGKGVFAWDVWMIYGPEAQWPSEGAPEPLYWEHQLSPLREQYPNYLDAERFAGKLKERLSALN